MKKLIDINSFKRENREKFNLLHASENESRIKNFYKNYSKTTLKWLAVLAMLLILFKLLLITAGFFKWRQDFLKIDPNKLQAVFLANNQIYFGHILEINNGYLILDKVYYFKVSQGSQSPQQLNLVKLGDEIYGPEDLMHIPNNQITFWQNLRDDSQVTKIIKQMDEKK